MTTRVAIKSLVSEKGLYFESGKVEVRFVIGHDNGRTTLEQELILTNDGSGWMAQMVMNDFPREKTITASAWKLADWMERMAIAIKDNTFDQINLNGL
jgi:hypothetical protein